MGFWFVDRVLPGIVAGAVFTIPVWIIGAVNRRHYARITSDQTGHIEQLTAEQTRELKSGSEKGG